MPAKKIYLLDMNFFKRLPHLEFGHWVVSFGDALIAHPGYQAEGSIPHPLGNGPALRQMGTNFLDVHAAAETKHVDRVRDRDALRPVVELQCAGTAQWTVLRSALENDASLIANLPLPFKKPPTRSSAASVITAPRNPRVRHGHTTVVLISTDKVPKARTYEVGICVGGDPSQESSWSILGPFDHCRQIEITGLEPGKFYYFRVRCFVGGVFSPWSEMVSIRAL
ncbi:hypothetical protein GMSM_27710 [Geomonas sp. Red276]